jgi:hypothetical protein
MQRYGLAEKVRQETSSASFRQPQAPSLREAGAIFWPARTPSGRSTDWLKMKNSNSRSSGEWNEDGAVVGRIFEANAAPVGSVFAVLGDVNYPQFEAELPALEAAGRALGRQMMVVKISSEREFEGAFDKIMHSGAARSWSAEVPSLPVNVVRWSRWRRAMPSRRSTINATL